MLIKNQNIILNTVTIPVNNTQIIFESKPKQN